MRSKADRSRATPIHFTRRGRCNDYEASPWHGPVYRLPFLDETALGHLERREYQSRPTRDRLRNRSDCFADRRCTIGFAWSGVHRHSDRPRHSCHRVRLGSTLAKKSSSPGEQCCFQPRPRTSGSRGFQGLAWRRLAPGLIKTCVRVHSNKKSGMHLINVVAASQFTRRGECRGDLALFPLQTRRHPPRRSSSAVATTLRVHSVIRLSLAVMRGMPGAPQQSVGGR